MARRPSRADAAEPSTSAVLVAVSEPPPRRRRARLALRLAVLIVLAAAAVPLLRSESHEHARASAAHLAHLAPGRAMPAWAPDKDPLRCLGQTCLPPGLVIRSAQAG